MFLSTVTITSLPNYIQILYRVAGHQWYLNIKYYSYNPHSKLGHNSGLILIKIVLVTL